MKQKIGDFNITGESEMEFIFRTFLRTAFITSVLNGQVSRKCISSLLAIEWTSYCVMKRSDNWPVWYSQSWTGTRTGLE